jgi:predicted AlkP superfamily phosphohydrolase/phosphomutase
VLTGAAPILMVGLDGFEPEIADRLLNEGRLPALKRLTEEGATIRLDHGEAKRTGLAWEHVSTGLAPDDAGRWGAIDFNPLTYQTAQAPTRLTPIFEQLDLATIAFDVPYFDLAKAKKVRGLSNWGAHDPGVGRFSRPESLAGEIEARFGAYPATPWIYGFVWHSADRTEQMAADLVRAVEVRSQATQWLLADRLPVWDIALTVVSEYHSAVEALWHGVDPSHPLYSQPSSDSARRGLEAVYEAGDRMLGGLMERFPEARIVAFTPHGMGPNKADVPSMLLLPELLFRDAFDRPFFREPDWRRTPDGVPLLEPQDDWHEQISRGFPGAVSPLDRWGRRAGRLMRRLGGRQAAQSGSLDWMPAARYKAFWRQMPAFALPAYYDGRIRINLIGRERHGLVAADRYDQSCDHIEQLVRECRDSITGEPISATFIRAARNKFGLAPSEADLVIVWEGAPLGLIHPRLGRIGPIPYRRTGGHTGGHGIAYVSDPAGLEHVGGMSAFDLVPTMLQMAKHPPVQGISGRGVLQDVGASSRQVHALQ